MGGGSTIAAAMAVGYDGIGIEIDPVFFKISEQAIPRLAELEVGDQARKSRPRFRKHRPEGILALPFQM
jgi:site-specific DNA-methyltransferase (adenine-specific)